jgi:hypothetical protein
MFEAHSTSAFDRVIVFGHFVLQQDEQVVQQPSVVAVLPFVGNFLQKLTIDVLHYFVKLLFVESFLNDITHRWNSKRIELIENHLHLHFQPNLRAFTASIWFDIELALEGKSTCLVVIFSIIAT